MKYKTSREIPVNEWANYYRKEAKCWTRGWKTIVLIPRGQKPPEQDECPNCECLELEYRVVY